YEKYLFAGKRPTLATLPEKDAGPEIILYGSNYQSGVSLRMSRAYVSDYRVGSWHDPDMTLAKAIAVSSAFPPLFSPIILKTDPAKWHRTEYADLFDEPRYRARLVLADGGVYDNMGIEAIWKRYETVLVSDAGAPLTPKPGLALARWSATKEMLRVLGIATEQQRALRKRWLIDDFKTGRQKGTYWGITTQINDYRLADALAHDSALTGSLKSVRTRLNAFSGDEQGRLINWGYALADTAMRRHVLSSPAPAPSWPIPEFPL
ncbi:MAG: alpha/beta hydrolase, partial [Betaproteobacteria bacterium HGW-Betaproteobacteria-18]